MLNRLTILEEVGHYKRHLLVKCLCRCGNFTITRKQNILIGKTKSCNNCHLLQRFPREYGSYKGMLQRCYNPKNHKYPRYGGRGITVCEKWKEDFFNFYEDMKERPFDKTLDRKNNNGNYEPNNCRWATAKEQANNK